MAVGDTLALPALSGLTQSHVLIGPSFLRDAVLCLGSLRVGFVQAYPIFSEEISLLRAIGVRRFVRHAWEMYEFGLLDPDREPLEDPPNRSLVALDSDVVVGPTSSPFGDPA